jgi:hypothetical protein
VRLHYFPVINNNREMPDEAACCEEENQVVPLLSVAVLKIM